jgi:hypothetical protein
MQAGNLRCRTSVVRSVLCQSVAQRKNQDTTGSQAAVQRNMIVFVMSHSVAESPTHKAVRQSQTRCPRCGAWSAADRCPQCGAHRMSAEIGFHPYDETKDLEGWQK